MGLQHNLLRPQARLLAALLLGILFAAGSAWARSPGVEVRRVGLSRVGENTMLTVVLSRDAEPRISPRNPGGRAQLVVEFPQARAGRLPGLMAGDDVLVEQVLTESTPGGGVKITLELFPDHPYNFWRQKRGGPGGQVFFILGLTPEGGSAPERRVPKPEAPPPPEVSRDRPPEPLPPPGGYGAREERGSVAAGSFAELRRLIPKAGSLLDWLEKSGWAVAESHTYDRPGQRFSRDYLLTNRQYPELAVKIVNLPANAPSVPSINLISLTTDRLGGETAAKYQNLRQWSFSRIRQDFEDIGDFFDDALKPLRVKLRQETQALFQRYANLFQTFLQRACPQNPGVVQKVMGHVKEKVNPRFEGVQYTVSEDPLVILNLVDFLQIKVFFLEAG